MPDYYELTAEDVGKRIIRAFGKGWMVADFMGQVLPSDVGKRVFYHPKGSLQVENNEQLDVRLAPDHYRMREIERAVAEHDSREPLKLKITGARDVTRWLNISVNEAETIARLLDQNDNNGEGANRE